MGKKLKKGRVPQKDKWVASDLPKKATKPSNTSIENDSDEVVVAKVRNPCPHIGNGIDLNKLSDKIGSSEHVRCEDCREGSIDRRGGKGKGKHAKKKGSASVDSKSESKAIWLCLACGHYACGGGLPTTPQCHAIRHARQTRHPLVVKFENPQLRWCFQCNTIIAIDKTGENVEQEEPFLEVVRLIKGHSSEESSINVEDVWFGSGSVTSEIKSASMISSILDGRGGYAVKGLVNLGNTCFFNSVLQNLLAIDRLRGYFLNFDVSAGPLSISLKKLFTETKPEAGVKSVINPRAFFGCVCSKAPQFRGHQQQDSHELLRCLLDGLCTEELNMRKGTRSSQESGNSSMQGSTFVDTVFGGQISSTVCCVECGHSSTVYESFLDLSLPVPTKRSPPKAVQATSRAKKTKLPPKRTGKVRSKVNKDKKSIASPIVAIPSTSSELSNLPQSSSTELNVAEQSGSGMENLSAVRESKSEPVLGDAATLLDDSTTWLDYLDLENMLDDDDLTSQNDVSIVQDSQINSTSLNDNDASLQSDSESINQGFRLAGELNVKPNLSPVIAEEEVQKLIKSSEIDQSSEVILVPQKEESPIPKEIVEGEGEASSSILGFGDDFDGLGDLFNEPEVFAGPSPRPSTGEEGTETSFIASESDPDEVDDTDSPVSVESCLAHFIKPELLANENAWHCENCSKSLHRQKLKVKRQAKAASKDFINGCETGTPIVSLSLNTADVRVSNGNIQSNNACNVGENMVLDDGKMDCSIQNCTSIGNSRSKKLDAVVCQQLDGTSEVKDTLPTKSDTLDCSDTCSIEIINSQGIDSCGDERSSVGCASDNAPQMNSELLDANCESEASESEESNSKSVKVKRDATKRVLINRAPPILTIHLKRFSQDARGRLSKLNGHVSFREIIQLRPYMDPRCKDQKYEYHLIGVVVHSGSMRGGHYVAYVRGGERTRRKSEKENSHVWYYASDNHVREVSLDEVLRCEAYILFYEKT